MDFFNSLSLELKLLAVAIAGFAFLALFSGNRKNEKRYMLVLAVLAAVGVYRFNTTPMAEPADRSAGVVNTAPVVKVTPKHVPLVSTSAK